MSVYTTVEKSQLTAFLTRYDIGELVDYQGISAGIENTNYFVDTTSGRYVLTLFESLPFDSIPYFLELTAFLAEHDVPCAHPVASRDGIYLHRLNDKPAAIVKRLQGSEIEIPDMGHAAALGDALGHMHLVGQQFTLHQANSRGPAWWVQTTRRLASHLDQADAGILQQEIDFQKKFCRLHLPSGLTHADLFKDNVLWHQDRLTGIIDFYYACDDVLLYDIAVTANAWFCDRQGRLQQSLLTPFLQHYHQHRPLADDEHEAWPVMLRAAALRFWLSRLNDMHFPKPGEITHTKNPDVFKTILLNHIQLGERLKDYWL